MFADEEEQIREVIIASRKLDVPSNLPQYAENDSN